MTPAETATLTLGREQIADVVEALRYRAAGARSIAATGTRGLGESYAIAGLVTHADLLDGLAEAIEHKAAGQLALGADHCPECGLDVAHDGHLPDCPIAETFVAYELLDDPAEHECDCTCDACTDRWRPEDAGPGILEAERYAAAQKLTTEEIFDFLAGPADPQRAAAADDPRGERDR